MVTKYQQGATASLDVKRIVEFFGGADELASALEKHAIVGLTPYAIRQWICRKNIPAARRLNLQALALAQGRKSFQLSRFVKKKKAPATPKSKVA